MCPSDKPVLRSMYIPGIMRFLCALKLANFPGVQFIELQVQ